MHSGETPFGKPHTGGECMMRCAVSTGSSTSKGACPAGSSAAAARFHVAANFHGDEQATSTFMCAVTTAYAGMLQMEAPHYGAGLGPSPS